MIDTIHIRTHEASDLIDNPSITRYSASLYEDGNTSDSGRLRNLKVTSRETGTYIKDSLTRYVHGTNLATLHVDEVAPALREIETALRMRAGALDDARVTRLDIAHNLIVPRPVREYLAAMTAPPRYRTTRYVEETLYFNTTLRTLCFYDKIAEAESRGETVPAPYAGQHVLRYELKIRRVSRDLGRVVTAGMLADPAFFRSLAAEWARRFHTVRFQPLPRHEEPTTVRELREAYAAVGVESVGGAATAMRAVDVALAAGHLDDQQARRQKAWLRALAPSPTLTPHVDVREELAAAVDRAAAA